MTSRLRFNLEWDEEVCSSRNVYEQTSGRMAFWVGNTLVWGTRQGDTVTGIHWHWIDFLAFLDQNWVHLMYEEGYPLGFNPTAPHLLRRQFDDISFQTKRFLLIDT